MGSLTQISITLQQRDSDQEIVFTDQRPLTACQRRQQTLNFITHRKCVLIRQKTEKNNVELSR